MNVEVHASTYGDPDVVTLIGEVQQEYVVRYGSEDATPMTPEEFVAPEGTVVVAYVDGGLAGCGAFRRHDASIAEIKRMYVRPEHRGRGVARAVLADLEARALAAGYTSILLETGAKQPEAMALYASSGYAEAEPFGHYRCSPLSRSYAKDLPRA
ncbi:MAG TPA: GNAT family N-acetyltransferase [Ornithinibacter sp.]|nr:GNAT family N-acetyltransferase [Ornithinibacter sp.]